MRTRTDRALKIILSVTVLLFAILLIISASGTTSASKKDDSVIPTTPVSLSNCETCHADIDDFVNPQLSFKHGDHLKLGTQCYTCHNEYPHQDDQIIKPTMETCFICHGTNHGKQGKISDDCNLCHPQGRRRPSNHTAGWTTKHDTDSYNNLFSCLMCHTQKQCIDCHDSMNVKQITLEIPLAPPKPKTGPDPIIVTPLIGSASCYPCHVDLNSFTSSRVIFSYIPNQKKSGHELHLNKGIDCWACHNEWPHQRGETKTPPMDVCADCHAVAHGQDKVIATGECSACHPPGFDLKQKPENHLKVKWDVDHGKQSPDNLEKCYSCHSVAFCTTCHKAKMLHPVDWIVNHMDAAKQNKADCLICHKNEAAFCGGCHHEDRNRLLVITCIECHDDFDLSWKRLSTNGEKAMSVHKGHVAKKWKCNICHYSKKPKGKPEKVYFDLFWKGDVGKPKSKRSVVQQKVTDCMASLQICNNKGCHNPQDPGKPGLIVGDELCKLCHPEK